MKKFMVLLFYLVAFCGVVTGVLDPQKKAQILELAKKCESVKGLPPADQKAKAGLTDKQVAACPKVMEKVNNAKAKAAPAAPAKPQAPAAPANSKAPDASTKAEKVQKLLKVCKEKGDTLSEDAKAKCAKLTKKVENAKQNANAKAAGTNAQAEAQKKEADANKKKAEEVKENSKSPESKKVVDSKKVTDDVQKANAKRKKLEEKLVDEATERLENGCYKKNAFYDTEDLYYFSGVESSFECQLKCGKLEGCEAFSWYNKDAVVEGKKMPNHCFLKAKVPNEVTQRANSISGPATCGTDKQKEFEEAQDETPPAIPGAASLLYIALSPRVVILSSFAVFVFGLVVSRTLCYTRRTSSRSSDNSSDLLAEDTDQI